MHDALVELLDKLDIALAESRDVVDQSELDSTARLAAHARRRLSYPEDMLVAALAGGTGSGKSSLFNAIAGEEVVVTGGLRPTTVRPAALVPAAVRGAMDGLLDDLGITERHRWEGLPWLCLIDLPDNDSVEVDHRHQVEALLPRVDVVIWVTDPEKYRDASLHQGHIARLSGYQDQFLFVLNQVDRMDPADLAAVALDLAEALGEDGIDQPEVLAVAAHPAAGPPIGVDRVLARLQEGRSRETVHRKLSLDLAGAATRLAAAFPGDEQNGFDSRWAAEVDRAVGEAREGLIADGGHALARFVEGLADEVGGEAGDRLREFAQDVASLFLGCVVDATMAEPETTGRSRPWRRRDRLAATAAGATMDGAGLAAALDRVIGEPIREILAHRGRAHAAAVELALAVADLERRATR
jgi:hypothetical protein